jgi:hypothetical protein
MQPLNVQTNIQTKDLAGLDLADPANLRQGNRELLTGNSFSYLSSPNFWVDDPQNAQFFRYTLEKSCTLFPFVHPQTFYASRFYICSASPNIVDRRICTRQNGNMLIFGGN